MNIEQIYYRQLMLSEQDTDKKNETEFPRPQQLPMAAVSLTSLGCIKFSPGLWVD